MAQTSAIDPNETLDGFCKRRGLGPETARPMLLARKWIETRVDRGEDLDKADCMKRFGLTKGDVTELLRLEKSYYAGLHRFDSPLFGHITVSTVNGSGKIGENTYVCLDGVEIGELHRPNEGEDGPLPWKAKVTAGRRPKVVGALMNQKRAILKIAETYVKDNDWVSTKTTRAPKTPKTGPVEGTNARRTVF